MVRNFRIPAVLAFTVLAASFGAGTGSAATMQWGAQVYGSWDTRAMDDWNDLIDDANSSGSNYDNIRSGYSFGGGPVVTVNDVWQFGAHFEHLTAQTSEDAGTEVKPSANAFGMTVGYMFPSTSSMNFGLYGAVDYLSLTSQLNYPGSENDVEGSGVGFQFGGTTNWNFTPTFAGNVSLGYRLADVNVDTIGGTDASGSGLESENYSGVCARVGFTFHQARSR